MELMPSKRTRSEAGFTLIDILFVVGLIGVLASLAIPGLMRARGAAQSASALGTLRIINSAELSFAISCGLGFYSPDLPRLGVPPPSSAEAYLPRDLSSGFTFQKSGYSFSLAGTALAGAPGSCNGLAAGQASSGYAAIGNPIDPAQSNGKYYGTNADGLIYVHSASLSALMPESGPPAAGKLIQ
jgi:type II secretory pathway pseudopilin PulG